MLPWDTPTGTFVESTGSFQQMRLDTDFQRMRQTTSQLEN